MAVLRMANDILGAMRAETARLSEEDREVAERTRLTGIKSLNGHDDAAIVTTSSTDSDVLAKAEADWRAATEGWERELEATQEALFRSKSPALAILNIWALTRLQGASGFRAGVEVLLEVLSAASDPMDAADIERWEMLAGLDAGESDAVLARVLGRGGVFDAPPAVDNPTSIDRVVRSKYGNLQGTERGTRTLASLKQEVAALDDEFVVRLEAMYRETSSQIEKLQSAAASAGLTEGSHLLEACRALVWRSAEAIRSEAPELFAPTGAAGDSEASGGGSAGSQQGGVSVDVANAENAYLIVRERKMRELESIGAWFRRFEPHNPIGYVAPALVRRAGLDLPTLVLELCQGARLGDADRVNVFQALAVSEPVPESSDASSSG